jgi:hypothetical protein
MRLFLHDNGSRRSRPQNERISRNLLTRTGQKPKSPPRFINLEGRTVMDSLGANQRTDDELEAIISETGRWAVNGRNGQPICFAASLRRALERQADFAASGAIVSTLSRHPSGDIVVHPEQIARLRKIISLYESSGED